MIKSQLPITTKPIKNSNYYLTDKSFAARNIWAHFNDFVIQVLAYPKDDFIVEAFNRLKNVSCADPSFDIVDAMPVKIIGNLAYITDPVVREVSIDNFSDNIKVPEEVINQLIKEIEAFQEAINILRLRKALEVM